MYYMLNLVFTCDDPTITPYGRFVDYDANQTNPFLNSKTWLQSSDGVNWAFFERDHQHLSFQLFPHSTLMVRVVNANQATENYSARITILMGRNDQKSAHQPMTSPIQNVNGVTGPVCIWDYDSVQASGDTGGVASWVNTLGAASLGSTAGSVDKYIFLVAATVQSPQPHTFSHDPDMDINC